MSPNRETAGSFFAKLIRARQEGAPQTEVDALTQQFGEQTHRQLNPDGQTQVTLSIGDRVIPPPEE